VTVFEQGGEAGGCAERHPRISRSIRRWCLKEVKRLARSRD
jgi:hypothetical protein